MSLDDGYRTGQSTSGSPSLSPPDAPVEAVTPARRAALDALEREFSDLLARPAA